MTTASELALELMAGRWSVREGEAGSGTVRYVATLRPTTGRTPGPALSRGERAVLVRALRGEANEQIAFAMGVASSTVATLLQRARAKLSRAVPEALLRRLCEELDLGETVHLSRPEAGARERARRGLPRAR